MTSRKRAAPGASPMTQRNAFPDSGNMATDSYMSNWNEPASGAGDINGFGDGFSFNDMNYAGNVGGQPSTHNRVVSLDGMNDGADIGAGQLVRRNTNQQLAARGRNLWDPYNNQPQPATWENTDDDEELEKKAVIAKKDAQSKRKQIPPFVQKLSRYVTTTCRCLDIHRISANLETASWTTATTLI